MARYVLCLSLLITLVLTVSSKKFTRCELVNELKKHNFRQSDLANWVCLVEAESSRDTKKVGGPNKNGSYDYGLFQINSKYWCGIKARGGDCNIKCEDLLSDNISNSAACAEKIFKRHNFSAWYGWRNKCQKSLPDISKC